MGYGQGLRPAKRRRHRVPQLRISRHLPEDPQFCVVELGGFYLDIIKDRLYTTGTSSAPRRSAQTAMHHVAQAMVRWLAPILSFTAEEVWGFLPGKRNESVFLNTWHQFPLGTERVPAIDWPALIALKADVARDLERCGRRVRLGRRSRRR